MTPSQSPPAPAELAALFRGIFAAYGVRKAVLFGSLARGDGGRRSDVDLLLVVSTPKRFLDRSEGILAELNQASPRPVDLLVYTPEEMERMEQGRFVGRALAEGKVIYESEE